MERETVGQEMEALAASINTLGEQREELDKELGEKVTAYQEMVFDYARAVQSEGVDWRLRYSQELQRRFDSYTQEGVESVTIVGEHPILQDDVGRQQFPAMFCSIVEIEFTDGSSEQTMCQFQVMDRVDNYEHINVRLDDIVRELTGYITQRAEAQAAEAAQEQQRAEIESRVQAEHPDWSDEQVADEVDVVLQALATGELEWDENNDAS